MDRRNFVHTSIAIAVASQLPKSYALDPVTILVFLGGLITAGSAVASAKISSENAAKAQLESAKLQAANQAELMRMQIALENLRISEGSRLQIVLSQMQRDFVIRQMKFQAGQINAFDDVVFDRNGEKANVLLSSNLDNYGTEFGVTGMLGSRRGTYNGTFSSSEAARFAKAIELQDAMPVPVDDGYSPLSPKEARETEGLFNKNQYPVSTRRFSTANRPTKDGWDLKTFLYVNSDNKVDAKIVPRNLLGI